ncbi:hypothetical protein [Flavobacterium sp.]|uniref:hypothetical protein n=1 Tax=Flavobacterium sp. TaxID=239 RepID=UPI002629998B|nr:hypothetical protein [Flavobacterium sp.]
MKFKILLFFYFISFPTFGQNVIFKVDDKDWEVSPKIVLQNDEDKKFKIKFSSLDNGKYFVINRLLYGNKTAKALAYFKEFDVYVVREAFDLKYYTFKEAFPKGGFYKDGTLKTIFGQKAERYSLDNDVLDIKIWITDGVQVANQFVDFLKNMGLLRNIPNNKKIVALSIHGLELELSDLKISNEKGRIALNLEDFLVTFKEKEDAIRNCLNALPKVNDSIIPEFENKTTKTFPYKITQNGQYFDYYYKKTENFTTTSYSSEDGTLQLFLFSKSNENGSNAQFFDYNLKKVYYCDLVDDHLKVLSSRTIRISECDENQLKLLSSSNNSNFYYEGSSSKFHLIKYELDEKNYPKLSNWNFKNGFIKSYTTLDKYLNQQTVTRTLEKGTFTFNFSK